MLLHGAILYIGPLALLFSVTPLGWSEWRAVVALSAPVVALDEVLKLVTRHVPALKSSGLQPIMASTSSACWPAPDFW